jgi:hypothetical protein
MAQNYPLSVQPSVGIQRDGTMFDTTRCTDGSYTRFYKGRPQKVGGCETIINGNNNIIRTIISINASNSVYVYTGTAYSIQFIVTTPDLITSAIIDVTPTGFNSTNPNYKWTISTLSISNVDYVIALAAPNVNDLSYYGILGDNAPLQPVINTVDSQPIMASGGVIAVGSYIFVYGSNGTIQWSNGTSIDTFPTANIATYPTTKFVTANPVKSGQVLSGIFWSTNYLVQLSLSGTDASGAPVFINSYVSTESTLLSDGCVVSLDPFFYWIGNNSFYQYNGSVLSLKNTTNKQWFFKNINPNNKEKVFGMANRIFDEIWWCFPYGSATENTNAIVYMIEADDWYDTDQFSRSCGISSSTDFPYPIMCSSQPISDGSAVLYPIWVHEYGWDQVVLGKTLAIKSYFTTNYFNSMSQNNPFQSQVMFIDSVVPDIEKVGNMTLTLNTKAYPNSPGVTVPIPPNAPYILTDTTEFLTIAEKATLFTATFSNNSVGGTFLMGNTQFMVRPSTDQRPAPAAS